MSEQSEVLDAWSDEALGGTGFVRFDDDNYTVKLTGIAQKNGQDMVKQKRAGVMSIAANVADVENSSRSTLEYFQNDHGNLWKLRKVHKALGGGKDVLVTLSKAHDFMPKPQPKPEGGGKVDRKSPEYVEWKQAAIPEGFVRDWIAYHVEGGSTAKVFAWNEDSGEVNDDGQPKMYTRIEWDGNPPKEFTPKPKTGDGPAPF